MTSVIAGFNGVIRYRPIIMPTPRQGSAVMSIHRAAGTAEAVRWSSLYAMAP